MGSSRIASVLGFMVSLLALGAARCWGVDDNYNWGRPTGLGIAPCLPADASSGGAAASAARVEEIKFDKAHTLFVTTTGSRLEWGRYSIILSQRLPVERELVVVRGVGGPIQSVEQIDDSTCQIDSGNAWVTLQANSTVIIKAKLPISVDLLALCKAGYHAQLRGSHLAVDAQGGFGVFPTDDEAFVGQSRPFCEFWYRLKPGQELWLSIFPQPAPADSKAAADPAVSNGDAARKSLPPGVPVPGNEVLRVVNVAAFFHNADLQREVRSSQDITGLLYRNGGTVDFRHANAFKTALPIALKWDAPGCKITPAEIKLSPEPNAAAQATFTFGPCAKGPAPRLLATYELPGQDGHTAPQTHVFAMPVNEITEVPRLPALTGLDAVVEALKDQKPRVIHSESDDFIETRRAEGAAAEEPKLRFARGEGNSSAEVRLAVAGDSLALNAKVSDPRCTPEVAQWSGGNFGMAGLDLYVSRPGSKQVRQFHFRALSPTGEKTLIFNENGEKAGDPTYPCRIVAIKPFGYEVHALIPLKDCLLDPNADRFLFDVALLLRDQFRLLYTGDPVRCAYRNNRYFGMAIVPSTTGKPATP